MKNYLLPVEEQGIFSSTSSSGAGTTANSDVSVAKQQVDADIDCAVAMFEKSGKVPATVMEASIFKKPYFIGK